MVSEKINVTLAQYLTHLGTHEKVTAYCSGKHSSNISNKFAEFLKKCDQKDKPVPKIKPNSKLVLQNPDDDDDKMHNNMLFTIMQKCEKHLNRKIDVNELIYIYINICYEVSPSSEKINDNKIDEKKLDELTTRYQAETPFKTKKTCSHNEVKKEHNLLGNGVIILWITLITAILGFIFTNKYTYGLFSKMLINHVIPYMVNLPVILSSSYAIGAYISIICIGAVACCLRNRYPISITRDTNYEIGKLSTEEINGGPEEPATLIKHRRDKLEARLPSNKNTRISNSYMKKM